MECWYNTIRYGVWRSLVARTAGGREVAGSNPVAPIEKALIFRAFFAAIICRMEEPNFEKRGKYVAKGHTDFLDGKSGQGYNKGVKVQNCSNSYTK